MLKKATGLLIQQFCECFLLAKCLHTCAHQWRAQGGSYAWLPLQKQ